MSTLIFSAEIRINGSNPYVLVEQAKAKELNDGWRKPMPVLVQINSKPSEPWHINMMPVGNGDYYLYLHGTVRKASNTAVGDIVTVTVSFDSEYSTGPGPLPAWFAEALAENNTAAGNWDRLSPSRQKEVVRTFTRLKSPVVRAKNLTQVMDVLSGKDGRFMGRSWHGGS